MLNDATGLGERVPRRFSWLALFLGIAQVRIPSDIMSFFVPQRLGSVATMLTCNVSLQAASL